MANEAQKQINMVQKIWIFANVKSKIEYQYENKKGK